MGLSRRVVVLVGFVLAGAIVGHAGAQGMPPANVVTDGVRQETIEQQRGATGEVRTRRRSQLAAEQVGLVVQLDLEAGDAVEKGEVIAKLDDTLAKLEKDRAQARVDLANATIDQRDAELSRAQRDLERIEELDAGGSASVSEIDEVRTRVAANEALLAQARADAAVARAELALAAKRLDDMTVRAPFAGRIVRRETELGQWLAAGDPVVELVSVREIEAWVDVPERVVGRLRELEDAGPVQVDVRVAAIGATVRGQIVGIVPEGDPLSRMFPVRLSVPNENEALKPGMSVIAMVPTSERAPTITIHKDAILRDDAGEYVYFDAGGMAMVARIERLFAVGDRVAIRPGQLKGGMRVIVKGNERIFPGQPLNIIGTLDNAPPQDAPANQERHD
ncbi:MAG: efflux RND transporter periplasmic adaptor subunit [Phycisphaerales bacterium]